MNWLELQSLKQIAGEAAAYETTRAHAIYRWVYDRVLEDEDKISEICRKNGLTLD